MRTFKILNLNRRRLPMGKHSALDTESDPRRGSTQQSSAALASVHKRRLEIEQVYQAWRVGLFPPPFGRLIVARSRSRARGKTTGSQAVGVHDHE